LENVDRAEYGEANSDGGDRDDHLQEQRVHTAVPRGFSGTT
jgi:hypothetical protein